MKNIDNTRIIEPAVKPKNIRQRNTKSIIEMFRRSDSLNVRDISDQMSLSKTSVNKIISQLEKENVIKNIGKGESTENGGKKPDLFSLNSEQAYFISMVFTAHTVNAAILNLKLKMLHTSSYSSEAPMERDTMIKQLVNTVYDLITISNIGTHQIYAIILQSGGVIDKDNEALVTPIKDANWKNNFPIKKLFIESLRFKTNVYFDNISRFFGYYELTNAPSRTDKSLMILSTLETSIGGVILSNGNFDRGGHGLIGEFGHICIDHTSTQLCRCGNYGCFETMVTRNAVFKHAKEMLEVYPDSILKSSIIEQSLSFEMIFKAADRADALSQAVLDRVIQYFYTLLYNSIFLIDPDEIIIQNLYAYPCKYFQSKLTNMLNNAPLWGDIKLTFSQTDEFHSAHVGAALYAGNKYFGRLLNT